MKKVRMGIVRLEAQGSFYAKILSGQPIIPGADPINPSDLLELTAVSNRDPAAFGALHDRPKIRCFTDWHEMITSGQLGEPRRFNWIMNTNWRPDSYYASAKWRGTWKGEGGGVLVNTAPRQLDLWMWLCGKPASVYTVAREGFHRNVEVETDATILAEYENGATGIFMACTHDMMGTDRMEIESVPPALLVVCVRPSGAYRCVSA